MYLLFSLTFIPLFPKLTEILTFSYFHSIICVYYNWFVRKYHHVTGAGITLQGLMITSHDQRTSPKESIKNKAWNIIHLLWFADCSVGIVVLKVYYAFLWVFLLTTDLCKLFFKQNCKAKIKGDGGELKVTECVEEKKTS